MQGEIVAFDLETTGLDIKSDEIIEIGIVKFKNGEVIQRYQSLVKPSIPIPPVITHLTGIHQDDVADAPLLQDLMPELLPRFGDATLVAHNASFDMSFMRRYGVLAENKVIDTYELAAILLPSAARYSLNSLTNAAGITLDNAHRALDDAVATGFLYWHLWREASRLPYALLTEIIGASAKMKWQLKEFFQAALAESLKQAVSTPAVSPFYAEELSAKPLTPSTATRATVDPAQVNEIFKASGKLEATLANFESRQPQIHMAKEVTDALNNGAQMMIEAGTGTGKSLAYLIPAALWATKNDQRVVVATNTINLQEQLLNKDIPIVEQILGDGLKAALMKGRGNYLCPRRLESLRRRKPANLEELRSLAKILVWMQSDSSGDRGSLSLRAGEWNTWSRLSAQDEDCTSFQCSSIMHGVCPFYRARKRAETAHLLITNHALLIADARIENRALPEYFNLIVDEAHHLEDAITNGLSRRIDQPLILAHLRDIGGARGTTMGDFLSAARRNMPTNASSKLDGFSASIDDTLRLMNTKVRNFFRMLHDFVVMQEVKNRYQMRMLNSHRDSGAFFQVQNAWKQLSEYFLVITDALAHLSAALPRYQEYQIPEFDEFGSALGAHRRQLADLHELLEQFVQEPDANCVYAVSPGDSSENLRINIAPLHVGPLMETFLNERKETIIMTSATLRTQGNFDHLKERLYADHYATHAVGSTFDYERSTLLYVPEDIPEPAQRTGYQKMLERGIIELAAALDGRVMVLFTSYAQLRETSKAITPRLTLGDILVYDQSFGTSREMLLESFKSAEKAVLMGTRSFWEGIDIPGDDLSAIVIARLPFAVPTDPIFAARSETYNNAFQQYAIPDAILRFRQGFGRLIRSSTDRGIVAIFDRRVISKTYGSNFLDSLPDCTVQYGTLENLPRAATRWLTQA